MCFFRSACEFFFSTQLVQYITHIVLYYNIIIISYRYIITGSDTNTYNKTAAAGACGSLDLRRDA